jgi:hypothetical protein
MLLRATYRNFALLGFALMLILGFGVLVWTKDVKLDAIAKDVVKDHSRFTPTESIDVAQAMKLVTHDPPTMLAPPESVPPLVLFPPSAEDLARLSGPAELVAPSQGL